MNRSIDVPLSEEVYHLFHDKLSIEVLLQNDLEPRLISVISLYNNGWINYKASLVLFPSQCKNMGKRRA